MTDEKKMVARLRAVDHMSIEDCFLQSPLFEKAADMIERLVRERDERREQGRVDQEIAQAIAEAVKVERERCASIAEGLQCSADAAFNERVRRSRKGEKHLELAAATAAGMSHQARRAAAEIRKPATPEGDGSTKLAG